LRNLSPEQRDAILRQITGEPGGSGISRDRDRPDRGTDRATTSDSELDGRALEALATQEPKIPVLKGDDTVIINIDLQKAQPGQDAQAAAVLPPTLPGQASQPGAAIAPQPTAQSQRIVELTQEERARREQLVDLVRSRNPYRLSRDGVLSLPGFEPISGRTHRVSGDGAPAGPARACAGSTSPRAAAPEEDWNGSASNPSATTCSTLALHIAPATTVPVPADRSLARATS
jgi:hypothetical protein